MGSSWRVLNIIPVPLSDQSIKQYEAQLERAQMHPGFEHRFVATVGGATRLDNPYDQALADAFVLEAGCRAEDEGFDAVCISSLSDSGLSSLRSRLAIPVIGAAQASFLLACMLGRKFSIVAMWPQWENLYRRTIGEQGLAHRVASIRSIGVQPDPANPLAAKSESTLAALESHCAAAIRDDGADVIVLGSTSMHATCSYLAERLDVPVVSPGVVAAKMCELLVLTGLSHSKAAYPAPDVVQDGLFSGSKPAC